MMGVFASLDLVLFFVFWEVMLIPMYFLIGIWGHERRVYAAIKFVLFTMVGSALMLTGIIYLYNVTGSFDFPRVLDHLMTFPALSPASGTLALSGLFHRLCHQGSPFPLPYLAARCSRGGAHGGIRHPGGSSP